MVKNIYNKLSSLILFRATVTGTAWVIIGLSSATIATPGQAVELGPNYILMKGKL
jgi:hypothetical protein